MVPSLVNLAALFRRFTIICLMRTSSPISSLGMVGSISSTSFTRLSLRRILIMVATSIKREAGWYASLIKSILPASILEKSNTSLMIPNREVAAFLIRMAFSLASKSSVSLIINSAMPLMAFIGVRISWDILARKLVLAWSAFSACSLAAMMSVISCMMIIRHSSVSSMPGKGLINISYIFSSPATMSFSMC